MPTQPRAEPTSQAPSTYRRRRFGHSDEYGCRGARAPPKDLARVIWMAQPTERARGDEMVGALRALTIDSDGVAAAATAKPRNASATAKAADGLE